MMGRLQGIYLRLGVAIDQIPHVKLVLRVTLVALVLMILWISVFYLSGLDSQWAQVTTVLILVLSAFPICNSLSRHRSRR